VAGLVTGCVQLKTHWRWRRPPVRELASLVVSRAWRRKGIASLLVRHVQEQSGPPLWLMCRSRLVPFYERFDFREVKSKCQMPLYFAILQAGLDLVTLGRQGRTRAR
jgi:predicted N-acetyltransferase YhbS